MRHALVCLLLIVAFTMFACGGGDTDVGDYVDISDVVLSAGNLSPYFSQSTDSYAAEVDHDVSSITVTPILARDGESVVVQGQAVVSGTASQPIDLDVGQNIITIIVTARDTTIIKTYIIVVTRLEDPNSNADLSGLFLSTGCLSPAFDRNTTSYIAEVAHGASSIAVTPVAAVAGSIVKVNGMSVTSGAASEPMVLDAGTDINVVVTSEDRTATKTYTIGMNFIFCSDQDGGLVTFTYEGQEVAYGTVVSAGSRCWLDRNLGASLDTDPGEYSAYDDERGYGDLFQWGRGDDGHQDRDSNMTTVLSETDVPGHDEFISGADYPYDWRSPKNDDLWQGVDGINNPCPPGWRIPTEAEWSVEISSWGQKGFTGAFNSPLRLTAAGYRGISDGVNISPGAFWSVGTYGMYWSDGKATDGRSASYLNYSDSLAVVSAIYRECALSVRCIKD